MCVNFVYKGLLYGFLLRIRSLLNVGHTAMEKPCPNWKGFKTIFCSFGQWFHALHLPTNRSLFEISDSLFLPFRQNSITEIYWDTTRREVCDFHRTKVREKAGCDQKLIYEGRKKELWDKMHSLPCVLTDSNVIFFVGNTYFRIALLISKKHSSSTITSHIFRLVTICSDYNSLCGMDIMPQA